MASEKRSLTVIRSPTSIAELHDIWEWNVQRYGVTHADEYLRYLNEEISRLGHVYFEGKQVATRPDLRYRMMRRRAKGHGHVAVYRFDDRTIQLLHVFHTAQDWERTLATNGA